MKTTSLAAAAAAALLVCTPALAQQPTPQPAHPAMPGMSGMQGKQGVPKARARGTQGMGGMQMCMAMMGGPSPAMILMHRQGLGLSAAQVQRLQAMAAQDSAAARPHMQEAMAAHDSAARILRAANPDFAAYEAALRAAANHAILGHVAMARSAVEARGVLTAEQRTRLQTAMTRSGMGRGMGQGMGGGMGGGMGMMGCPMMGGM